MSEHDKPLMLKEMTVHANNRFSFSNEMPDFYIAKVKFTDGTTEIETTLDRDVSNRILEVVGDALVAEAQRAAVGLTTKIVNPQLPATGESEDSTAGPPGETESEDS